MQVRDGKHIHSSGQVSMQHVKELITGHDAVLGIIQKVEEKNDKEKNRSDKAENEENKTEKEEKEEASSSSSSTSATSSAESSTNESHVTTTLTDTPYKITVYPVLGQFPQPLQVKKKYAHFFDIVCLDSTAARSLVDPLHFLKSTENVENKDEAQSTSSSTENKKS